MIQERPTVTREGDILVIHIPMTFKKRGGRKEIIVPEGLSGSGRPSRSPTQEPLVTALARAHHWQELLDSGQYTTITDLAEALKVDRSYVSRMLCLTLLAPDIIEAILRGAEPSGLSYRALVRGFPSLWSEQRQKLNFPACG